ncbi:MAG TPA: hypothetical protein VMT67_13720 [Terriglobales bacterium]|nr:hypothetical protein [Terriglobales bacterium]
MRLLRSILVVLLLSMVAFATALPLCDDPCTLFNEGDATARVAMVAAHGIRLQHPSSASSFAPQTVTGRLGKQISNSEPRSTYEQKPRSTPPLRTFLCTFLI